MKRIIFIGFLVLLTTGCGTLFREEVQQVPELPPGTNTMALTNLALSPETVASIEQTGRLFGPYGEIGAGALLSGLSLYLAIRNQRLKRKLLQGNNGHQPSN